MDNPWHPGNWLGEGTAMNPCCTPTGDFTLSVRPSARCALLTRILFTAHGGWDQQIPDASPPWAKFLLSARLLLAPGARDWSSVEPRWTTSTLYRRVRMGNPLVIG